MSRTEERGFLKALKENSTDVTTRLAYADWLEENARPYEAFQQRVKAGVSQARYKVRRKSDGLFSDGRWGRPSWSTKGREWRRLGDVKTYFTSQRGEPSYGDTPWSDLEVVVFELRIQAVTALPVSQEHTEWQKNIVVREPGATKQ